MKTTVNALVCASLLAAGAAAQAEGLNIGGSLGSSRYKGDDVGGISTDRSDTAGKIYGGYDFTSASSSATSTSASSRARPAR
jgi:hypothetical protein